MGPHCGFLGEMAVEFVGGLSRLAGRVLIELPDPGLHVEGLLENGLQSGGVEVDVGHRGEKGFQHENIDIMIPGAELPGPVGHLPDFSRDMDQKILKCRCLGVLATHAEAGTSGAFGRLFALITEHSFAPPFYNGGSGYHSTLKCALVGPK